MSDSYTKLHLHLVWATKERTPCLLPHWETGLHGSIRAKCQELKCPLVAVGGVSDHMHILLRLNASVSVSEIARHLKGGSSHFINQQFRPPYRFFWQGGYGAFTVSPSHVEAVKAYVENQKIHHLTGELRPDWEIYEESKD